MKKLIRRLLKKLRRAPISLHTYNLKNHAAWLDD